MDQVEPEDQIIPRDQQKRRCEANLGGDELLPAAHVYRVPDEICSFPSDVKPPYQGNAF